MFGKINNGTAGTFADLKLRHILGDTVTSIPSVGPNVGDFASIDGSDMDGLISLTVNTLVSAGAVALLVSLGTAYSTTCYPTIFPANAVTAALHTNDGTPYLTSASYEWLIWGGPNGIPTGSYSWYYHVGGK